MIKTSRNDILWNYAANLLNIGVSIVVLPLILKMLSPEELGLWYVFLSISSLALLIDFGFSSTLMRHISYAMSGAQSIQTEGVSAEVGGEANLALVKSIIQAGTRIYRTLSRIALLLLVLIGTFYIVVVLNIRSNVFLIAWFLYILATYLNILSSYWIPILKGSGAIKAANKVVIFSKLSYLFLAMFGLIIGGGLALLSLAFMLSIVIQWIWAKFELRQHLGPNYQTIPASEHYTATSVFKKIWPNSKKFGFVTIGSWLTNRASTLISSYYLGLTVTGQLGVSIQILQVIGNVSSLLLNSYLPELASTKTRQNMQRYKQLFSRAILVQWATGLVGSMGVVFILPFLLRWIEVSSELLPFPWLLLLSVVMFLEQNHSAFAILITLSNKIPFVKASLISGFSILGISIVLLSLGYGIGTIILVQGLVQLTYNNWYWPYYIYIQDDFKFKELISYAIK